MSLPLKDFRLGITEAIDVWLDAEAVAFDTDGRAVSEETRCADIQSLSAGRGNAVGGESRPRAPGPARGLRAQAATAYVADSAERRSPAGQDSAPAPDESHRHDACGYTLEPPR